MDSGTSVDGGQQLQRTGIAEKPIVYTISFSRVSLNFNQR